MLVQLYDTCYFNTRGVQHSLNSIVGRHHACYFREHATSAAAEFGGEIHNVRSETSYVQMQYVGGSEIYSGNASTYHRDSLGPLLGYQWERENCQNGRDNYIIHIL